MSLKKGKDELSDFELMLLEIDRIEAMGGCARTVERVRQAIFSFAGAVVYINRCVVRREQAAQLAMRQLDAGRPREEVVGELARQLQQSRRNAQRHLNMALDARRKAPGFRRWRRSPVDTPALPVQPDLLEDVAC